MKKCAVIAGNGPSLAAIDYKRLPKDFDVFRCNQFYLEDAYYLGRQIDSVFFVKWTMLENFYTLQNLISRREYSCNEVWCPSSYDRQISACFPTVNFGDESLKELKELFAFLKFWGLYEGLWPTSGIYMCLVAAALGYEALYLAGFDLYQGDSYYAFDVDKPNLLRVNPAVVKPCYSGGYGGHGMQYDMRALDFLAKNYGVKLYNLCPTSKLGEYLELAPDIGNSFVVEKKGEEDLKDMLVPRDEAYWHIGRKPPGYIQDQKRYKRLKNNLYYRIFSDLLRLPSDLRYYAKKKLAYIWGCLLYTSDAADEHRDV